MTDDRRPTDDVGDDEDISLARLTEAFAEVLGKADAGSAGAIGIFEEPTGDGEDAVEEAAPAESVDSPVDEPPPTPLGILEAMLFVGHPQNVPLTAQHAASVMRGVEPEEVHELVGRLNRRYDTHGCPYRITSEGAGYRLVLREEFYPLRDKFYGRIKAARLSQAAIECLALVAYNQPLAKEEIDNLRGVASAHVLAQLVRRRLLRIERTETQPRQTLYYTTRRFLTLLGLEKLDDLPQTLELERP
jgi:segregation and condensation protein B